MLSDQHLLCICADKSMGAIKDRAFTVIFKFSTAVLLSPSVRVLGPNMDSHETWLFSCWEKVRRCNVPILYFCFLLQLHSCPPFAVLFCSEGNGVVGVFIGEKLLSEINCYPYSKREIITKYWFLVLDMLKDHFVLLKEWMLYLDCGSQTVSHIPILIDNVFDNGIIVCQLLQESNKFHWKTQT